MLSPHCTYNSDKRKAIKNYLLNTSPRGFWGSIWILLSSVIPWEDVVSVGTREGSSVIRGVLCGGSVGLNVVGWGGCGTLVTGFVTCLVVTGTYLVVGFGVSRVVVPGVGRVVVSGVGRVVGLVTGLSVTIAGTYGGLRVCLVPPTPGILLVISLPPLESVLLPLNIWYGSGGSIITLGITAKRIKMGPKWASESLAPETIFHYDTMSLVKSFLFF